MGVDAMIESLDLVKQGTAPKVVQDLSQGSYESWFGKNEAKLDWSQSAQQVYNVIRAANPQPSAWTTHDGNILKLFDSRVGSGKGEPGEVMSASGNEIEIAAREGSIIVSRVRADAGKISAEDYIAQTGLTAGVRLGT